MSSVQHLGTGRRKTSTARVILRPGTGKFTVNDRSLETYFFDETHRMLVKRPLEASDTLNKFDIHIRVEGGGMHGQAGAVQHGIVRALVQFSAELRDQVASGRITVSYRLWSRAQVKVGGVYRSGSVLIEVDELDLLPFSSITDEDLVRTGEPDVETLRRRAAHAGPIQDDTVLYRVEFHVVRRPDNASP